VPKTVPGTRQDQSARPANTSQVIARYLSAAGIRHVFGYPGDPTVEFLEALRCEGAEFVLARREGTAAFMAEAYGQLTGRPGVCVSTLGPGSSNLVNGVANAYLDRVPMIAISGQIAAKREALFTHQVLDHNRLFAPISKWTATVRTDNVSGIMRRALRLATAERPGPIHLTTPADTVGAAASDASVVLPPMRESDEAVSIFAAEGTVADPLKRLAAARRGVIVTGISAVRGEATEALVRLAETAGMPVVVGPMAKGVFPEDHPYFAGTLDMACNAHMWDFLGRADLILAVGFDAVELIKPWSPQADVIHVDSTPNTDQIYYADIEVVGSIRRIVSALADGYRGAAKWSEPEIRAHRNALFDLYRSGRVQGRLNPTEVVDLVRAAMPVETVVTTDVGSHKLLVGQGWMTPRPRGVLMTNGLSSMGYSLPAAITAQLINRSQPVVCFVGDGGLAMVQGELRLASSLRLGLTVVVFCDNSLNRIELKQSAKGYPSWGTLIDETDITKLAQSMGCEGAAVDTPAALEQLLSQARPSDRPLVIGAKIDPAQYSAQF
jgi:acetolactate synthase-1/2/3 large subunit